ncbi:MAG: DUF1549 and DUF1553 domain-containing protein [Fuerstiella sp.]|nr:DUF1549 and DUF1553 domain-containing protein [Fuerstiella sp.]
MSDFIGTPQLEFMFRLIRRLYPAYDVVEEPGIDGHLKRATRTDMKRFPKIVCIPGILILLVTSCALAGPRGKAKIPPARRPYDGLPAGLTDHAAGRVDAYFDALWQRTSVTPAPVIDDATFLRRASLVLNGITPDADEVSSFLADDSDDKREFKVEQLLTRSRYADYWAFRFREWITQIRDVKGQSTNLVTLYYYGRQAMAENRSWAQIARDLLATDGDVSQHGWANFALYFDTEPNEVAEAASRMFLGTNLACAQCHDDPYVDEWTHETYWGMAAFFARSKIRMPSSTKDEYYDRFALESRPPSSVSTLPGGDASVDGDWGDVRAYVESEEGEVRIPGSMSEEVIMPTPLAGETMNDIDTREETRRVQFVAWIVDADNHLFARAAVNRVWLALTGFGFVDSYDGFSPRFRTRHEELLDELAREFIDHNHDLKWLMRTIVLSRVFQLEHGSGPEIGETWHAMPPRLLNGDQWLDSVVRATGEEERVYSLANEISQLLEQEHDDRVDGVVPWDPRSEQTDKSKVPRPSEPPDVRNAEQKRLEKLRQDYAGIGERVAQLRARARTPMSPTSEALMSMNGEVVAASIQRGATVGRIAELSTTLEQVEAGYLAVLGRHPEKEELQLLSDSAATDTMESVADLLWTLLQTTEFRTY